MKKTLLYALMCFVLCACGDSETPEGAKNPISFCITLIDEHGNNCGENIYNEDLAEYITVNYKGNIYEAKKNSHNEEAIYLSCYNKSNLGYVVEFGGIDGSKEFENESFTIDCGNGETNVVTFSNRKVVTEGKETFVQDCKLNGIHVDKSQIECKAGIHYYVHNFLNTGIIVSIPIWCQIRFMPVDKKGNSLLDNSGFLAKVKEGTTFTYRGVTSNIETDYTGSKLKLKLTDESFGELEKEPRILFGTFHTNKILKDQTLEINWFDGSKDVVEINFLSHVGKLNDPTSAYYDPNVPQQELDIRVNGELLTPGYTYNYPQLMIFAHKKVFDLD